MYLMFYYASSFNSSLSGWDTISVENMKQMFECQVDFGEKLTMNNENKRLYDI